MDELVKILKLHLGSELTEVYVIVLLSVSVSGSVSGFMC